MAASMVGVFSNVEEKIQSSMPIRSENESTVEKIRRTVPVRMSSPDLVENPAFSELLLALSCHVTEEGVSSQLEEDLDQVKQQLVNAKQQWLQQHVLYQELQDLVVSYETNGQEMALSSEDEQLSLLLRDSLTLAEVCDYIECSPDSACPTTLLGLNKQDLQARNPYKQHIPYLQQKVLPELEGRLRRKCERIVTFYNPNKISGDNRLQLAKASQLPALIEADTRQCDEEKRRLRLDKLNSDKHFWLFHQGLMDSLAVLEKLVLTHRLRSQVQQDKVMCDWLTAKCDALCLKIRMFEMSLLCETYKSKTISALKVIRKQLEDKEADSQKELLHTSQTLKAYESMGLGFDTLVEEYGELLNEVENKQWALQEIGQSLNS